MLMVFLVAEPQVPCRLRRVYGRLLVCARYSDLDINTAKFRVLFWHQWLVTMRIGTLSKEIWSILQMWKADLPPDMQLVEGANSVITRMGVLSPNIGDVLLSSRHTAKHELSVNDNAVSEALAKALDSYKGKAYKALEDWRILYLA